MRKSLLKSGVFAAFAVALLIPAAAKADGPSLALKVEPGVAVPLTKPQSDRFDVGAAIAVKPLLNVTPWLAAGPSLSALALPSNVPGVGTGTAYGLGMGAMLHRPHDNDSTGLKAASPWIDADASYVRTGDLNRFGLSVGAGVHVPTSEARTLWVGPFARYTDVVQSIQDRPGYDNSDGKFLVLGVSVEFGAAKKKPVEQAQERPKAEPKPEVPKMPGPKPPQALVVTETFHGIVQFPYDSSKPLPASLPVLQEALKLLTDHADLSVTLEGHASSEGTDAYNQALSERRAQAVKDFLVANGIRDGRLTVKGFGESTPLADNATEAGRAANRRVEYSVSITFAKEGDK